MEPTKLAKQMIDFQKSTFDNVFNAMILLQEQTERMINMFWGQNLNIPEESQDVLNEWAKAFKKGRDDFKKTVDNNFNQLESFFTEASQGKKPESK